jgi:hypothetical protein
MCEKNCTSCPAARQALVCWMIFLPMLLAAGRGQCKLTAAIRTLLLLLLQNLLVKRFISKQDVLHVKLIDHLPAFYTTFFQ